MNAAIKKDDRSPQEREKEGESLTWNQWDEIRLFITENVKVITQDDFTEEYFVSLFRQLVCNGGCKCRKANLANYKTMMKDTMGIKCPWEHKK